MENTLNSGQAAAALAIKFWYDEQSDVKQTFVLTGYAGTGKTYLIDYTITNLLNLLPEDVAFVTPTGKAASVLIQRGRNASTIHRLIYNIVETEYTTIVGGKKVKSKRKSFIKKPSIPNYKLIVIDEISMVDADVMKDLLSYGIPILCAGDLAQLPPILKSNGLLEKPDAELTEIVRQSADNTIVKIATMARNNEYIPFGNYGDVLVLNYDGISEESKKKIFLHSDQVLCGKNSTRRQLNNLIRSYKGIDTNRKYPQDGEKIICNVNNWEIYLDSDKKYNLVNGTIGYASKFREVDSSLNLALINLSPDFLPDCCREDILIDDGNFKNKGEYTYDMHQRAYCLSNGKYALKMAMGRNDGETTDDYLKRIGENFMAMNNAESEEQIEQIDYAYAISVHKSQGSEWPIVTVIDESKTFGKDRNKWLYTAITRAKKKLIILR